MEKAKVLNIKLVSFHYNVEYEPAEGAEVRYVMELLHRAHPETQNLDILVNIKYLAKDYSEPVLQASCLTLFRLTGVTVGIDTEGGEQTMTVSHVLGKRITQEAISHARALLSIHTVATPFVNTHVNIEEIVSLNEMEARKNEA